MPVQPAEIFPAARISGLIPSGRQRVLLVLVVLAAAALRLAFINTMTNYDEFGHVHVAADAAAWRLHLPVPGEPGMETANPWAMATYQHWAVRPAAWAPMALLGKIFPLPFSAVAWPFLCSIGSVLVAYAFGTMLGGFRTGMFAASLAAVFPLHLIYATQALAEEVAWFFTGLAALLFYISVERRTEFGGSLLFGFMAGVSAGISVQAHVLGGMVWAAFFYWAFRRRCMKLLAVSVAGTFCVMAAAALAYMAATGDPFYDLHVYLNPAGAWKNFFQPDAFWIYLSAMFGFSPYGLASLGFFYPALIIAAVYLARRRLLAPLEFFVAWIILVMVFLQFCPQSISPFRWALKYPRYLGFINLPVAIIIAAALAAVRPPAAMIAGLFLAATSCVAGYKMHQFRLDYIRPFRAAAEIISSMPRRPLVVWSWKWELHLNYLMRDGLAWPMGLPPLRKQDRPIRLMDEISGPDELRGTRVLLNMELADGVRDDSTPPQVARLINWVVKNGHPIAPIGAAGMLYEVN